MTTAGRAQDRKYLSASLDEVDQLVDTYRLSPMHAVQTTTGLLGAKLHQMSTSRLEVRRAAYHAGAILSLTDLLPRFYIAIAQSHDATVQGVRLTDSNLCYCSGSNGAIIKLKPDSCWYNLSFDWDMLHAAAETHGYVIPGGDNSCAMPVRAHRELLGMLHKLVRGEAFTELPAKELEDELSLAILRLLNVQRRAGKNLRVNHQRMVHRVIDFIHAEYQGPVTITELCQLAGVGERTLQYRFKAATGMPVQQYLMRYRLLQARSLLLRDEGVQVGEVARRCGIQHAGRFAHYYTSQFGESPRETQARVTSIHSFAKRDRSWLPRAPA